MAATATHSRLELLPANITAGTAANICLLIFIAISPSCHEPDASAALLQVVRSRMLWDGEVLS